MWYWGGGVHWWGWLFGALAMIVFWAAVVWVIWYLVTVVAHRPAGPPQGGTDPKGILDERLARGEIDAEEYRRLRDLIHDGDTHRAGGERPVGTRDSH